jgi:hypothetical protein
MPGNGLKMQPTSKNGNSLGKELFEGNFDHADFSLARIENLPT